MSGAVAQRKPRPYAASDGTRPLAVQWPGPPQGFKAGPLLRLIRRECPEAASLTPTQRDILERLVVSIAHRGQVQTSARAIAGLVAPGNARRTAAGKKGCTIRTVRTGMAEIEARGLLRSLETRNEKKRQTANVYVLGPVLFSLLESGKVFTPVPVGEYKHLEVTQKNRATEINIEVARKRRSAGQTAPRTVKRTGGARPVERPGQPVPPMRGESKAPELRQRIYDAIGGGRVFREDGTTSDLSTLDEKTLQKIANTALRHGLQETAVTLAARVRTMRGTGLRVIGLNLGILLGRELRKIGAPVPPEWEGRRKGRKNGKPAPIGDALALAGISRAAWDALPEAEKTHRLQMPLPLPPSADFMAERRSGAVDFTPPKTWKRP